MLRQHCPGGPVGSPPRIHLRLRYSNLKAARQVSALSRANQCDQRNGWQTYVNSLPEPRDLPSHEERRPRQSNVRQGWSGASTASSHSKLSERRSRKTGRRSTFWHQAGNVRAVFPPRVFVTQSFFVGRSEGCTVLFFLA